MEAQPHPVLSATAVVAGGDQRLGPADVDQVHPGDAQAQQTRGTQADELVDVQVLEAGAGAGRLEDVRRRRRVLGNTPPAVVQAVQRHLVLRSRQAPSS